MRDECFSCGDKAKWFLYLTGKHESVGIAACDDHKVNSTGIQWIQKK